MDKIIIKNLKTEGILGIHQREQDTPQPIQINVVMSVDTSAAAAGDDIHQTVNYSTIAKQIIQKVQDTHYYTVEALIAALADMILENEKGPEGLAAGGKDRSRNGCGIRWGGNHPKAFLTSLRNAGWKHPG